MGQNSIHSNISKEDIVADIRMTLGADFERKKSIVIVEGKDDILFFRGKLHPEVELFESYSGKQGVLEIANFFDDSRVLGICDADFDTENSFTNIYFYDYNCLEMMLINDDAAFCQVFYVYYQGQGSPLEIKSNLFEDLKWLSIVRKLNSQEKWELNLRKITFDSAYDKKTKRLDQNKLENEIKKRNPGWHMNSANAARIAKECQTAYTVEQSLKTTQGHDFINYFHVICKNNQKLHSKMPSTEEILRALICAFSKNSFQNSKLYQSLAKYQEAHDTIILSF